MECKCEQIRITLMPTNNTTNNSYAKYDNKNEYAYGARDAQQICRWQKNPFVAITKQRIIVLYNKKCFGKIQLIHIDFFSHFHLPM